MIKMCLSSKTQLQRILQILKKVKIWKNRNFHWFSTIYCGSVVTHSRSDCRPLELLALFSFSPFHQGGDSLATPEHSASAQGANGFHVPLHLSAQFWHCLKWPACAQGRARAQRGRAQRTRPVICAGRANWAAARLDEAGKRVRESGAQPSSSQRASLNAEMLFCYYEISATCNIADEENDPIIYDSST